MTPAQRQRLKRVRAEPVKPLAIEKAFEESLKRISALQEATMKVLKERARRAEEAAEATRLRAEEERGGSTRNERRPSLRVSSSRRRTTKLY